MSLEKRQAIVNYKHTQCSHLRALQ